MTCPPADTLVQFAAGSLSEAAALAIEEHLDACSTCRTSTSALVRGDLGAPKFGRYRLDTVLGSGGMGIVYRAWDPELARAVAIKVVRRTGDAEHRARLVREAQSLARLSHANVCHVYDVGSDNDEDGVWLAMELVEGATLRVWASSRGTAEILAALRGAAHGLAAAHAVGLVHRDVKPENVLVDRSGRAVVTDFGLARADLARADTAVPDSRYASGDRHYAPPSGGAARSGGAGPCDPIVTATGVIAGTPAYLAPEQITADVVDARADQFAWATMAWELLTGARPFPAEPGARLAAIRAGLERPRALAPDLGDALVRALALRPSDRFATMTELVAALDAPPARRPRRAIAIAAGFAVAAGGVGAWRLARTSYDDPPSIPAATIVATVPPPIPIDAALPDAAIDAAVAIAKPIDAGHPRTAPIDATAGDPVAEVLHSGKLAIATRADLAGLLDECILPVDPAHPDALQHDAADWGRITRREIVEVDSRVVGQGHGAMLLYEMRGARGTYRFEGRLAPSARNLFFDFAVGQLVLRCPDAMFTDDIELYQLPPAWGPTLQHAGTVTAIARAPQIADLSLHARQMTSKALPTDRTILVAASPTKQIDGLWEMGDWFVDPATMRHADRLAPGRTVWLVVDQPRDEAIPDSKKHRRILRGVDALTLGEVVPP